jgi:D-alanyl-D-alanine carboxypeptidase (penicillin-binding protein 5/6)
MKFALALFISFYISLTFAAELPPAPALAAKSYALYDYTSNQFLVSVNGDERVEPASLCS